MKNFKRMVAIGLVVLAIGATGMTALALSGTPAEIVAGLTGKALDSVLAERSEGKTYGTIANEAGKLDEFKDQMLKAKKAILDQRVAAGTLTQERANEIMAALEANQANCDGTGGGRIGQKMGAGFGGGMGSRQGRGQGGSGFGQGICGGVTQ